MLVRKQLDVNEHWIHDYYYYYCCYCLTRTRCGGDRVPRYHGSSNVWRSTCEKKCYCSGAIGAGSGGQDGETIGGNWQLRIGAVWE